MHSDKVVTTRQPDAMAMPETDSRPSASADKTAPQKKMRFSMVRTFVLADLITLGNAFCGTGAVLASMSYVATRDRSAVWAALILLPLALVCDALDGAVARWRRRSSPLGADLDSLADIVSFGVAPAALGFALGLRGGWDAIALCFFVACGISRLARYNVTAAALSDDSGKVRYYEGTPIPTSLALVLALGIAFGQGAVGESLWLGSLALGPFVFHPLTLMYVISGALMVSTFKIPKP
ncbi:MAG: CDP-diacylglycerol--serine O-phosphatidyltransferase [Labilithrix sp.]|nr:CDP-diacylglycerol--serine O-phosphatidyltransferase [Labilithrix sp.]